MKNTIPIFTIQQWLGWFWNLPIYLKAVALIILLRPVIDNFYELKEISILASPLYWVGALTPILAIIAILRLRKVKSSQDQFFYIWGAFVFFSVSFMLIGDPTNVSTIEFALKLTAPIFLYALFRRMVYSQDSFTGLLTTFFFSCIIAFGFIIYEALFGAIGTQISRGLVRYQGGFADIMNYAVYLIYGSIIILYRYLCRGNVVKMFAYLAIIILGLISIKHNTTFFVFTSVIIFFAIYSSNQLNLQKYIVVVVGLISIIVFNYEVVSGILDITLKSEREVLLGVREGSQLFQGRMSRWQWVWNDFINAPLVAQLLGYPLSLNSAFHMVGINVHNDFFRIIFLTGFIGSFFYFLFLITSTLRALSDPDKAKRFLMLGNIIIVILYSITTLPMFYANMLYPMMIIFAYTALPLDVKYPDSGNF